jgi:hypothetical protein
VTEPTNGDRRVPVVIRDTHTISIEHIELPGGFLQVLHGDAHTWSKSTLRQIDEDINVLLDLTPHGYVIFVPDGDTKLDKFGRLLGFEFHSRIFSDSGVPGTLYSVKRGRKLNIRSK